MGAVLRESAEIDVDELEALWTAVNKAGGAVGFRPDSPQEQVRAAVEAAVADVRARRHRLIVADSHGHLAGTVFLQPGVGERMGHRGDVLRLMVHPRWQGHGLGVALLDAAVEVGRALGLRQLRLSVRGGTDLPAFYRRRGWTEVGVFPAALRLTPTDFRDEHWFQLDLT